MTAKITGSPLSALKYEITSAHNYHRHVPTRQPLLDEQQPRFLGNERNLQRLPLLNQPKVKIAKFKLNGGRDSNNFYFKRTGNHKDSRNKKLMQTFKGNVPSESEKEARDDKQHSNFPFPANYKKIDFNKINPYKLAVAAEFLAREKRRLEEPFIKHAEKMEQLANRFDQTLERNKYMLETSPIEALINAKKEEKNSSRIAVIQHEPYSDVVREKSKLKMNSELVISKTKAKDQEKTGDVEIDRLIIRDESSPGHYWIKSRPGPGSATLLRDNDPQKIVGKSNANGYTSVYLPDPQTVQNVQNWLKANFSVKPVPLILHPPKHHKKMSPTKSEPELHSPNTEDEGQDENYGLHALDHGKNDNKKDFDRTELRELHIINGLVKSPKVFHGTVENSFARGYDLTPARNLMQITRGPIHPHYFRFVLGLDDFSDNEIVFQTRKNILYVTARSAGTVSRNPRKIEEIIELPAGVTIKNLKFYRSTDKKIIIEEIAINHTNPKPEVVRSVGFHYPPSRFYY